MDKELNDLFAQFLSRPDSIEKLEGVLSAFGGGADTAAEPSVPPTGSGLPDLSKLGGLLPLLNHRDDDGVALLKALRPYLHDGREKRVDEAIEMLRLAKLLPLLTQK